MGNHLKITLVSAALAVFALPVVAQSTSTTAQSSTAASTPVTGESIQDRKENQQDRLANGVNSGQLTAGETITCGSAAQSRSRAQILLHPGFDTRARIEIVAQCVPYKVE
jgi:hypothetical protein